MQHRQSCRDGAYAAQAKRPRRSNQVAQAGNRKHDHHTESRAMSRRTREKDASLQKLPKHHVKYFFITLVFAAGLLMFLYPVISNLWNQYRNSLLASHYTQTVQKIDTSKIEAEWKEAEEYNKNHTENYIKDAFTQSEQYILTHPYDELLNPDGNEVMGSLEIPKISVTLAIYHGMGEEALSKGCGHIEGTSLPIGGKSSHAVLAAHRGLAGARLFTDLDQLKKGDVFYLHSRLLERAAKINEQQEVAEQMNDLPESMKGHVKGGGSLTALPIIETQAGDVSAYIPTNVISITDGQIYLETDLFNQGFRPAINVGISVSRVGGSAQIKSMKKVAGTLKIDMAQYRELESFSKFSSDMDPVTAMTIDRGRKNNQLLIQPQYSPMPVGEQVAILYCGVHGLMHDVPVDKVRECQDQFLEQMRTQHQDVIDTLAAGKIDDTCTKTIEEVMANIAGQYKS